ncbi:hypothetical protein ALMP_16310 [Streptomyces sp. A012304]|nr:hypothetical protein ALMP_16310 [Streptomyces sp. A012304]
MPPGSTTSAAAALRQAGAAPLRPGDPDLVGPYVPLGLLGSGGMGRVYLARPVDGSPGLVAVKVIRPEYAEDPRFRRRFEREASVHARLRTPHTPRLRGTGFRDELLWMATEYLPGLDLAQAVREDGPLETAAVWRLTAQLARALSALSAAGIVHRDLKPSNVLLSVRGAHVIDFGISKAVDSSAITGTGNRVGTPAYMSPEHLRTGHSDTASDVFSLAGTLVYAATGRAPFGEGTGVDVMHRVAFEEPNPEVIAAIGATDEALGSLLSASLAKDPTERPTPEALIEAAEAAAPARAAEAAESAGAHSARVFWPEPLGARVRARQEAYEALHHTPVAGKPAAAAAPRPVPAESPGESETPARLSRAWPRRKPVLAAAAALAACLVAAVVFVLTRQDAPASAHAPDTGTTSPVGAGPVDASPSPEAGGGPSPEGGSGRTATDPSSAPDAVTSPAPDASPTGPPPATGASAPAPSAPGSPTASPDGPSPDAATPPWISDCAHYAGSGRTRQGDSGKRVLQVQCMLTKRGYGVGDSGVDGTFGSGTETAVRAFQGDKGLGVDGVVGRETWAALRSAE